MEIFITMRNDRVRMRSGWRPGIAEQAGEIPGGNWSEPMHEWSFPLTMHTLRRMREVFGSELAVHEDLRKWAQVQVRQERKLKVLSKSSTAILEYVPRISPILATAMADRTYQQVGARFGAVAGSCLFADEPGLGKTAMALAAIMETGDWYDSLPSIVIAPKVSLKPTWERQIRMWAPDAMIYRMPEGKAKREAVMEEFEDAIESGSGPVFLVINPAMIRRTYGHWCPQCEVWLEDTKLIPPEHYIQKHLANGKGRRMVRTNDWPDIIDRPWNAIILDESHELLATYQNKLRATQSVTGLLDMRAKHKFALTGTPLRGEERRLWGTLDWVGYKTGGYWNWVEDLFEVGSNGFGKVVYGVDPARAPEFYKQIDRLVLRRTRAEVRPDLPIGQRLDVLLEMSDKQAKQYKEFELLGESALAAGMVSGQGVLSELTRLKQMAFGVWSRPPGAGSKLYATEDSPKIEWLIQFLLERGITGKPKQDWLPEKGSAYKYVVASQFTEVLSGLERVLNAKGIKTMSISGAVTDNRRNNTQEKFQSKDTDYRVLLLQSKTGGVSLDLDAWCDEMVILDEMWLADDQVQLEGRINNRSGRVASRTWWYVRTEDTIEQRIADDNWRQHNLQHALLDGRRGVTVALHLIKGEPSGGVVHPNKPRVTRHRRRTSLAANAAVVQGPKPGRQVPGSAGAGAEVRQSHVRRKRRD